MLVDLVQTITRDGIRLSGIFQESEASGAPPALDAVCLVHGTGGNFYNSSLFEHLAERLLRLGCSVLRVNTRGHDGISTAVTAKGGRRQGAAYEAVDDCRHDLAAWVGWLRQLGYERIGLVGHSLGAVKSIYACSREEELAATAVVAISPPRLSYSWFTTSEARETFLSWYHRAAALVEEGEPTALLEVTFPLPFVITAAGYVEKYGPDEPYNYLNFADRVKCPLLVTFGGLEVETNVAFQGAPAALQDLSPRPRRLSVEVIPGGDHFYTSVWGELAQTVEAWLRDKVA